MTAEVPYCGGGYLGDSEPVAITNIEDTNNQRDISKMLLARNLEVEIEYIAGHGPNYYRTTVYQVRFGNKKEPTRMAKEIFRSPTMQSAVQTLAGIVTSR